MDRLVFETNITPNMKFPVVEVYNKKDKTYLGSIIYWHAWRKFVWEQDDDVIMSHDCLQEVSNKIIALTKEAWPYE